MPDTINVSIGTDTINVTVSGGTSQISGVSSDTLFTLDGSDSGLKYNSSKSRIEMYVEGTMVAYWSA